MPDARAPRHIALAGADNFRDLGGYRAGSGAVAWGRLYRSGHLGRLTSEDVARVARLGLRTVCDLRSPSERADQASRLPPPPPTVIELPVDVPALDPGRVRRQLLGGGFPAGAIAATVRDSYRAYVTDFAAPFAGVLRTVADRGRLPALIHCNGGKDRTGFAAMLVLLALGVPRETIVEDYLLTNHCTRWSTRRRAWLVYLASRLKVRPGEMRGLLEARVPYLEAAFAAMVAGYGSVEAYLRDALGVTDELRTRLRAALLE